MPTPPRLTRGEAAALNEEGPALLPENKGEELQKGGVEPITTNVKDVSSFLYAVSKGNLCHPQIADKYLQSTYYVPGTV